MQPLKVGILTFHFSDNYGALMQAYGLRTWLIRNGAKADFINYHPLYVEDGGSFIRSLKPQAWKANLKIAYLKLSSYRRRLFGNRRQRALFERFRRDELGVATGPLRTEAEVGDFLSTRDGRFDLIICGSDQIWSASVQKGLDPVYFANILPTAGKARRISYAPSFGRDPASEGFDSALPKYLDQLDAISVREKTGADFVNKLIRREIQCVPDPAILLGDFSELHAGISRQDGDYVFCYALRTGTMIREVAGVLSDELRCRVVSPYNVHRRWREIGETIYPSPAEWTALIRDAKFVVTNSFHGAVLSILLRKPFVVVELPGKKAALNDRSLNLLRELHLESRLVSSANDALLRQTIREPINWDLCSEKMAGLKSIGESYLRGELGKVLQ